MATNQFVIISHTLLFPVCPTAPTVSEESGFCYGGFLEGILGSGGSFDNQIWMHIIGENCIVYRVVQTS